MYAKMIYNQKTTETPNQKKRDLYRSRSPSGRPRPGSRVGISPLLSEPSCDHMGRWDAKINHGGSLFKALMS